MNIEDFWQYIRQLQETSGNDQKQVILDLISENDEDAWSAAIAFIAKQQFENVGIANKTVLNSIEESALDCTSEEVEDLKYDKGSITAALLELFPFEDPSEGTVFNNHQLSEFVEGDEEEQAHGLNKDITDLYKECNKLHDLSGNALQSKLASIFMEYYPPAVSFCVLTSDFNIGIGKKSICMAVAGSQYTRSDVERARAFIPDAVDFVQHVESGKDLPLEPTAGNPFEPMLAKNKEPPEDTSGWIAELKLDGHRLIIHVVDGKAYAFTRDLNDVTHSLPELEEIDWPEGNYIFDCEAVAYSEMHGELPFTKTSQRIGRKHDIDKFDYTIRFYMFDLILNDGEDVTKQSQADRFEQLQEVTPTDEPLVEIVRSGKDVDFLVEYAEDNAYEGVIVKDTEAEYAFGKRDNAWRKIKVTEETVDLRIVSFEKQGTGADADTLGSIGVETSDGHYVGEVGTGFSDKLAKEIWDNQDRYMNKIIEVQFEGFDEALRFPSFKYFREDTDPDSLEKVKELAAEV